jgi:hypothetical protein
MKTRLEMQVLDYFDDVNLKDTFTKIASCLPRDILDSPLPERESRFTMDDDDFALSVITKTAQKINRFPINDKVNTALSNQYFDLNHTKLPLEAQKIASAHIVNACAKFKIEPTYAVKCASKNYEAETNIFVENNRVSPGGDFRKVATISEHYFALKTQSRYPMQNPEMVKKAEAYFDQYCGQLKPAERHEYAKNVSSRAQELGVKLASAKIQSYAGGSFNADVEANLSMRRRLLEEASPYYAALNKLASYKGKVTPEVFAETLGEIDKRAGLDKYYDGAIQDPYKSTFSMRKQANIVYEKDGVYLSEKDIENCAHKKYDTLKSYFGHTLADGLKKEGYSAFVALPTDAQEIIARIAHGEIQ